MRLYSDGRSGNCDKVIFVANYLGISLNQVELDSVRGETRTPEFLSKNPMGQIPFLEISSDFGVAQSNAIIRYLADGSDLVPTNRNLKASMDSWMFWEANNFEFFIAGCIGHMTYMGKSKETRDPMRVERAKHGLNIMDTHLSKNNYFVGEVVTIADAALLAYTRNAHNGGFNMSNWPSVRKWILRTEQVFGIEQT